MYTKDNIELRSEKVRKVIGKIPPFLIRIGTAIITLIMIAFALAFYTIPYPISLNVEGIVDKNMREVKSGYDASDNCDTQLS